MRVQLEEILIIEKKNGNLGGIYNVVKVFVENGKMRGIPTSI